MQNKSFHKLIFKNTGLFGFSQLIIMFARLFSNKLAAVFLGPLGVGIVGLLDNILGLIQGLTNFGVPESAVREIALVEHDAHKFKKLINVIYKWGLAIGFLGFIITLIFLKPINQAVFENESKYIWIACLSFYFIFTSIAAIRLTVLRATKKVVSIVKYNISVAILSSFIAGFGYYFFGIDAIIPVVILTSLCACLLSFYFTKDIIYNKEHNSVKAIYVAGLPMAKVGLLLSVSVIFGQICFYCIRWFLKEYYTFETLGLYQVSNTILVGYLGLIFAAMANDFYPRLCNYENDKQGFNDLVNDQTEIALLLVVPAVLILYLIAPFLLEFLYTIEFLNVLDVLKIGLVAIVFKAIVWPIGYIALIKGNKKLFLKQNLLGDAVNLVASVVLFYYLGLLGLGIAMVIMFVVSGLYNYYLVNKYYHFRYRNDTLKTIGFSLLVSVLIVLVALNTKFENFNIYIIIITLLSVTNSLFQLKKKLNF